MSKPITDTLHHIGDGHFISLASDQMTELVKKVNETGKTGKLVLTISVKKSTRDGAMHITGSNKLQLPAELPMETMLFATEEGDLTIDNPKQRGLDLKSVPDTTKDNLKQAN